MSDDRTTTAIRFGSDLHERLRKESARREVSINELVTWAVERALTQWEAQDLDALLGARAILRGDGQPPRRRPRSAPGSP